MGVYIKDMEMPSSCDNCPFCGCYVRDDGTEENYRCCVTMRVLTEFDAVEEYCPLVPVPPHGRLIDADALDPYILNEHYGYRLVYDEVDVAHAPTIIPASEEGE